MSGALIFTLANESGQQVSLWQDYLHTQFDPAHLLSETGFTIVAEAVQLLALRLIWPRLFKRLHQELDDQHGIEHHDDHIHYLPRPKKR